MTVKKNLTFLAFFKLFLVMLKWRFWEFLGIFWCFFVCNLTCPFICTSIFRKIKTVEVVHMACKFHSYLTCYSQKQFKNSPEKLILLLVFRIFATTPFYTLRAMPQFWANWKVSWRYIILPSFISIVFVVTNPLKNLSTISTKFQWNSTGVLKNYWKMTGTNGTSRIPLKFRWNSSSS